MNQKDNKFNKQKFNEAVLYLISKSPNKTLEGKKKLAKLLYFVDFNFFEAYLIGLRAISADYKKGLFLDDDCDIAIRPDVLHFRRSDVSQAKMMIEEGRKAAEDKMEEIRGLLTKN